MSATKATPTGTPHTANGGGGQSNTIRYVYGEWVVRFAWPIIIVSLLLSALATFGMSRLQYNPDNRVFFSPDNPELQALEALEQTYSKTDNVFIAVAPVADSESGDGRSTVFTPAILQLISEITDRAWTIPYSSRVDSLTNYQYTRADGDDLLVSALLEEVDTVDAAQAEEIKRIALSKPFLVNRLVSEDGTVTGVNITVLKPEENDQAVYEVSSYVSDIVQELEVKYPDVNFYVTGGVLFDVAFAELPNQENAILVPLMFFLILLVVGLSLKTVWATILVLALIGLSVTVAMGIAGWAGFELSAGTTGAPVIIPTLSVAHCVHLMVTLRQRRVAGYTQHEAVIESLRVNLSPIIITSVTTAIGFLSLNFSEAPPFRVLGNIVAIGVMAACVLSLTLLPAILSRLRMRSYGSGKSYLFNLMHSLGLFVVRAQKPLLWICGGGILLLALGATRIELNDNFLHYFGDEFEIRQHTDFVENRLTGLNAIEFSLPAPGDGGISDPAYLAGVDAFVEWLKQQDKVTNVGSIAEVIKDLNQSMHGDDSEYYRIPESRDLAAQYLLLYEMSLPYGLDLNNQIDIAKSQSRVIALVREASSVDLRELNARAEQWLQQNQSAMYGKGSGLSMIFAYISERNINSMLFGSLAALFAISLILIFALRSLRVGLVSLVPNLVPAAMALGIWGYLVGEAGLSVAIVVAVTLGIIVDDTVHFLSKYLRARREQGLSPADAVVSAFDTVGVALWITSVALIAGFLVLSVSGFKVNAEMGLLSAATIGFALLCDYFFLPAVLLRADRQTD
jgi:predicted RND superfamily exporter protein